VAAGDGDLRPDGRIGGLVLAGGLSRRLGRDKALLEIEGRTMLRRSVELLAQLCGQVRVSGRDPAPFGLDLDWFPDDIPGIGPIGGIITALRRYGEPCLAMSCDLPLIDEATLRRLVEARRHRSGDAVMTTFLHPESGYIQALVAIYEPEALPVLLQAVKRGVLKLSQAVPPDRRCHIPVSQSESAAFFNLNYPADLAALSRMGLDYRPGPQERQARAAGPDGAQERTSA
jgi:molybdopterin-guanine dinucleotide biosynthesis protein A